MSQQLKPSTSLTPPQYFTSEIGDVLDELFAKAAISVSESGCILINNQQIFNHISSPFVICNITPFSSSYNEVICSGPPPVDFIVKLMTIFHGAYLTLEYPLDVTGNRKRFQCGFRLAIDKGNFLWNTVGIHFPREGNMVIYRAYNHYISSSIYIAVPLDWSEEGLQYVRLG